jgi:hypothetical protein
MKTPATIKRITGMANPIRSAGLPADWITPRSKTHVFMSSLSGGEKLGFDRTEVFLVSFIVCCMTPLFHDFEALRFSQL